MTYAPRAVARLARPLRFARAALALGTSAALGLVVACGSSDAPAGPKYATEDAFCAARADAECAVSDLCTVKKDACVTKRKDFCKASTVASAALGLTYNPSVAELCILQVSTAYRADKALIKADELAQLDAACLKVFAGSVEKNKACTATAQCTGSLICDKGFCADAVIKGADTPCGNPGESCVPGYFCTGDGVKTCVKLKALGELCVGTDTCDVGLLCNGTCKKKLEIGDTCVSSRDCASNLCDDGLKKCTVGLTFATGAESCKKYGGT
ncbi:MAG TPA: hypothetical protein PLR99_26360 [Polyangiaceae bacterium]|nr:hypothetical protein [Polyangiaceae bacterium]